MALPSVPYTFVAGTTAASAEVNQNFSTLYSRCLDKTGDTLTGTLTSQHIVPATASTYDLGSALVPYRAVYADSISGGGTNSFGTVAVSGQSDVVADTSNDTLTLVAGTGITLTTSAGSDSVTITNIGLIDQGPVVIKAGGVIYRSETAVGNVGTGEDDLLSQSIAANVLSADGQSLTFRASGTFAANSNIKRLKVKWGATTILDMGATEAPSGVGWVTEGSITRTSSSAQLVEANIIIGNFSSQFCAVTTAAETLSGAVTFKLTGEATATNDIIAKAWKIWFWPIGN